MIAKSYNWRSIGSRFLCHANANYSHICGALVPHLTIWNRPRLHLQNLFNDQLYAKTNISLNSANLRHAYLYKLDCVETMCKTYCLDVFSTVDYFRISVVFLTHFRHLPLFSLLYSIYVSYGSHLCIFLSLTHSYHSLHVRNHSPYHFKKGLVILAAFL